MAMRIGSVVAVGLAAVVGGCGDGDGHSDNNIQPEQAAVAAAGAAKACDILTEAAAEQALGRDSARLETDGGPMGYDMCQYGYQGERMMDTGQATLTVQPVDIGSVRQGVESQGYSVEPVEGLGDQAFWSKDAGLHVGKGNRTAIYLVGVGGESDEKNKQRAIALARATVAKL